MAYVAKETNSTEDAVERAYGKDVGEHLRTDLEESSIEALSDFKDFLFDWGFLKSDFDVPKLDRSAPARARAEGARRTRASSKFGAVAAQAL